MNSQDQVPHLIIWDGLSGRDPAGQDQHYVFTPIVYYIVPLTKSVNKFHCYKFACRLNLLIT